MSTVTPGVNKTVDLLVTHSNKRYVCNITIRALFIVGAVNTTTTSFGVRTSSGSGDQFANWQVIGY